MQNLNSLDTYIGKSIGGNFQIKTLIGKGSMGKVYSAQNPTNPQNTIAVKLLDENEMEYNNFAHQAKIAAKLGKESPYISEVKAYGIFEKKIPYYVMEYLQGKSLAQMLTENPLSLEQFLTITQQICLGLKVAHQGVDLEGKNNQVIHEDLKPSNIFIMNNDQSIKILDFAISGLMGNQIRLTKTKGSIGTLGYRSPEQMRGEKIDVRSDIYSLGIMMYEMLTEHYPWEVTSRHYSVWYKLHNFQNPRTFKDIDPYYKIPQQLEILVMKCLEKKPENRPQNIEEVLNILEAIIKGNPSKNPAKVISINQYRQDHQKVNKDTLTPSKNQENNLNHHDSPTGKIASLNVAWPQNKPIGKIVFPQIIKTNEQVLATLWTMLPQTEIDQIKGDIVTLNNYTFIPNFDNYPLVLWSTIIYGQKHETHWLNCFLDLSNNLGKKILYVLAETGIYRVLFFAQENPQTCAYIMTFAISQNQQKLLAKWLEQSKNIQVKGSILEGKKTLQWTLEKVKSTLIKKLTDELGEHLETFESFETVENLDKKVTEKPQENLSLIQKIWQKIMIYLTKPITLKLQH